MKWLLRTMVALSLLACLGYASYAFGMYVLSKRLFGDTILEKAPAGSARTATVTKSSTRKSGNTSNRPRVEVNVLDAQNAGPGPQAPSLDSMEREVRARDFDTQPQKSRQRVISAADLKTVQRRNRNEGSSELRESSPRYDAEEDRPRRRRKRRRRRVTTDTSSSDTRRNTRRESTENSRSSDDSSRDSDESFSEPRRERRRERSSSSDSPRRERRIESPVPSEGGGSSSRESPVPVPE